MTARTIPLKADWDYQPKLGSDRGHHAARTDANGALADFIERRAEGALLVVGHRGSGKTSSVIAAANRAAELGQQDKAVIPILIKATSIDRTDDEGRKTLLQSLIWALHRKAEEIEGVDKGLRSKTKALYLDATASIQSDELSQSVTRSLVSGVYPAAVAAPLTLAVLALQGAIELGPYVVPAALAPFAVKLAWDRKTSRSATRHYKRTYGFADMQHDFEALLRDYRSKYRIVFILDEFDKDDDFAAVIQPLKMLLNQGDAIYIVITAPEKARDMLKKRDVNSTLFSEVLFINRPLFREMEKFIDDIVEAADRDRVPSHEYDDFRCCMRYKSQTSFFDLYGSLRDRRAGADERGRPLITVSLNEQETTEANLQRAIEYVYDRKAYGAQSMQMINDGMLDAMYETAAKAEASHGKAIEFGDRLTFDKAFTVEYPPHSASAVRDLLSLLYHQGYLLETDKDAYQVIGRLAKFDPAGIFVEEENAFIAAYDALLDALSNFSNVQSKLVDGHGEPFSTTTPDPRLDDMIRTVESLVSINIPEEARACRGQLRQASRPLVAPDTLRRYTDAARTELDSLRTYTVDLLSNVLVHSGFNAIMQGEIRPNLVALAFVKGKPIHNAVYQSHEDDNDEKITITILAVQDASLVSKMRSAVTPLSYHTREIYIVLVGDVEPIGLQDDAIVVGPVRGKGCDRTGANAFDMAKKQSTYILAVTSPPDTKTTEAIVSAVSIITRRLESNKKKGFEGFWSELLRAVDVSGHSPPLPYSRPRKGVAGAGQRTTVTRHSSPRNSQEGTLQ